MLLTFFAFACIYLIAANLINRNKIKSTSSSENETLEVNAESGLDSFDDWLLLAAQIIALFECYSVVFTFFTEFPHGGFLIDTTSKVILYLGLSIIFSRARRWEKI